MVFFFGISQSIYILSCIIKPQASPSLIHIQTSFTCVPFICEQDDDEEEGDVDIFRSTGNAP